MRSVHVQTHEEFVNQCQELAATEPESTHKIASNLLAMGEGYYHDACSRAKESFNVALGAGIVGALFFFGAATLVMVGRTDRATITVVSGAMIEVLSGVVFCTPL